ncbi:hypothetical protein CANCADRAFT_86618 [Tortispora caseinolytica NRRL Y-17796]|uniref:Uncharacterized protein n=1 Tax=Tortispora caseinolytica NRRL Y-17796 TaxID=767744 RepID=A0A1E4TL02_9ASCO|nr:hypothetical protein CANCADRAFT_86618 [Tortispora caseinolytica NRRL Y-17796]
MRRRKSSSKTVDSSEQELDYLTYDYLAKIILLGPSGAGKSCLLHRFTRGEFRPATSHTVGVEFTSRLLKISDSRSGPRGANRSMVKRMKLQLWDTAGQERFRSITRSYYRGSAGVLLVADSSDQASLPPLEEFLVDVKNLTNSTVSIVLAVNKTDLLSSAQPNYSSPYSVIQPNQPITYAQLESFSSRHPDIPVIQTSAQSGLNVEDAFIRLASMILTKIELGSLDPEDSGSGVQYGDRPKWDGRSVSIMSSKGSLCSC